ncbi:MAG: Gx transporter family protein [Selenomonas sp.]|uniref:Gx transporter family protein n=1 Tax=Selenomonas sp. TaxID=2053611 RepID=UPI0025DA2AE3|nr:Gx transporter family protein [Selenomonas sp.]MCR5758699.1 Gx transporter family protein [Selenomonas sp.]
MELRNHLYIALLTALSLVLFLLEGLIPLPFIAPGAKLGLANIVTVYALFSLGPRASLLIILLRTSLASFFGGGPTIFLYSISGGLLSLAIMTALKKTTCFSLAGISAAGGFAHHCGQLLVASFAAQTLTIFRYLPVLGPCGLITGLMIGWLATKVKQSS